MLAGLQCWLRHRIDRGLLQGGSGGAQTSAGHLQGVAVLFVGGQLIGQYNGDCKANCPGVWAETGHCNRCSSGAQDHPFVDEASLYVSVDVAVLVHDVYQR